MALDRWRGSVSLQVGEDAVDEVICDDVGLVRGGGESVWIGHVAGLGHTSYYYGDRGREEL